MANSLILSKKEEFISTVMLIKHMEVYMCVGGEREGGREGGGGGGGEKGRACE